MFNILTQQQRDQIDRHIGKAHRLFPNDPENALYIIDGLRTYGYATWKVGQAAFAEGRAVAAA